jgi:hypothetical protein
VKGHVTGDIKRSTTGFWFDALEELPVGFWPSDSAYLVRRPGGVRNGNYQILAVGRLVSPFAVWLRK